MPTIKQRLANYLLGDDRKKLQEAGMILSEAIQLGPRLYTPEQMIGRLAELDSRYLDLLVRQFQTTNFFDAAADTEEERLRSIFASRRMYDQDVITKAIVDMWTDFGFGINVDVSPRDEVAQDAWSEFWESDRNAYVLTEREIHRISTQVLRDGDFLMIFFISRVDGKSTVRIIATEEIKGGKTGNGVITDPQDSTVPVFYRREHSVSVGETSITYFRDWRADDLTVKRTLEGNDFSDGRFAEALNETTDVISMLVAHGAKKTRGWPLMATGVPWSIAYRDFLQDRVAINKAVGAYVDKLTVQGGQRAIDNISARLQSSLAIGGASETNPRPATGATWLQNDMVNRERMSLTTGATDAEADSAALIAQAGLSGRVYPHWLGRGDAFRLATATSMEQPVYRAFNRYQMFWSSVWEDIVRIVLRGVEKYGKQKFSTYDADIQSDNIIELPVEDVKVAMDGLVQFTDRGLVDSVVAGLIAEQYNRIMMQTIGVRDVDNILDPEDETGALPELPEELEKITQAFAKIKDYIDNG